MRATLFTITMIVFGSVSVSAQTNPAGGTTSGPAAGKPATLGTGGQTTATRHMTDSLTNHGGPTVRNEQSGQAGGTASTVRPGASDAGAGVHVKN